MSRDARKRCFIKKSRHQYESLASAGAVSVAELPDLNIQGQVRPEELGVRPGPVHSCL